LPASTLVFCCYRFMFDGCTNLNHVRCLATDISAEACTYDWLHNVAATGTFVKAPEMEHWTTGDGGIPAGWTVEDHVPTITIDPLTFQAVEAGTITVKKDEGSTLNPIQYSVNGGVWAYAPWNSPIDVNAGDVIRFRGNNGTCCVYVDIDGIMQPAGFHFECSNPCYVYGHMMSLIDQDGYATNTTLTEPYAFFQLFYTGEPNITILNHPTKDIVLPATTLTDNCYNSMFMYCQGITRAPALPATTLAAECYIDMFSNCTSLATAPILPATALASDCYRYMFSTCDSLTVAPELPATELYNSCYYGMFSNCKNLTTAPSLPATTLANDCYRSMFYGCESLTVAPALPATTLAESCYERMFRGCRKLATAPALPATTLVNSCYRQMFYECRTLKYVVCLATDISASDCLTNWLSSAPNTNKCTFVKASEMTEWPRTTSGIPNKWIVQDINTFTNEGNWNVAANWSHNAVPVADSSVLIAANATIPNGYTANAKFIIVDEDKTLTIAEGGQLIHSTPGVVATVQKSITGHGGNDNSGWYFVASPMVTNVTPTESNGFLANEYDLYYYDEPTHYWRNYKPNNVDSGFSIEPQKGYLYANSIGTTLSMTGTLQPSNASVTISGLSHEASTLTGFNLVGNPFACNATIDCPCYTIQTVNGEQVIEAATNPTLHPCEGVMVQADDEHESVTFTKVTPDTQSSKPNNGSLQITLSQVVDSPSLRGGTTNPEGLIDRREVTKQSNIIDNAIVSFNEGDQLGKFYFGTQDANIYIPQNHKEYAIAYAGNQTEMPLNFEAHENGEYTLTISAGDVIAMSEATWQSTFGYLHLIDNLTGNDVDLLQTPSYTFTAHTSDYESRFRLVFAEDNLDDNDDFAFIDANGNIIINGIDGHATIQLIDLLGHVLITSDVHSDFSLPTSDFPGGMYLLRLINGDNVKTQKIVVR